MSSAALAAATACASVICAVTITMKFLVSVAAPCVMVAVSVTRHIAGDWLRDGAIGGDNRIARRPGNGAAVKACNRRGQILGHGRGCVAGGVADGPTARAALAAATAWASVICALTVSGNVLVSLAAPTVILAVR